MPISLKRFIGVLLTSALLSGIPGPEAARVFARGVQFRTGAGAKNISSGPTFRSPGKFQNAVTEPSVEGVTFPDFERAAELGAAETETSLRPIGSVETGTFGLSAVELELERDAAGKEISLRRKRPVGFEPRTESIAPTKTLTATGPESQTVRESDEAFGETVARSHETVDHAFREVRAAFPLRTDVPVSVNAIRGSGSRSSVRKRGLVWGFVALAGLMSMVPLWGSSEIPAPPRPPAGVQARAKGPRKGIPPFPANAMARNGVLASVGTVTFSSETPDQAISAVGARLLFNLSIQNSASDPLVFDGKDLAVALRKALPKELRLLRSPPAGLQVPPGSTAAIDIELVLVGLPKDLKPGEEGVIQVPATEVEHGGMKLKLPAFEVKVRSVLTPDWEDKGLVDAPPHAPRHWNFKILLAWLVAIGAVIWSWARRLRKSPERSWKGPEPIPSQKALADLEALRKEAGDVPIALTYEKLSILIRAFLIDRFGIKDLVRDRDERGPAVLLQEVLQEFRKDFIEDTELRSIPGSESRLLENELDYLGELAVRVEEVLFADEDTGLHIEAELDAAEAFLSRFAEEDASKEPLGIPQGMHGAFAAAPVLAASPLDAMGADGVVFAQPAVFWFLVPLVVLWIAWMILRKKRASMELPTEAMKPKTRGFRRWFGWVPKIGLAFGFVLSLIAMAGPQWGNRKQISYVPSVSSILVIDESSSMDSPIAGGGTIAKFEAARDAALSYLDQQKGTTNRIGLMKFSGDGDLVMNLTLDHSAVRSAIKRMRKSGGGTTIPNAIMTAMNHFIEMSLVDADPEDPNVQRLLDIYRFEGLGRTIEEARKDPALMDVLIAPEKAKVIIVLSDGEGGNPEKEVAYARKLGAKIYTIGIARGSGKVSGYDEKTMRMMAVRTGGLYFRVDNPQALKEAFDRINELQKEPVKIRSAGAMEQHEHEFAYWAWLAVLFGLGLAYLPGIRLRRANWSKIGTSGLVLVLTLGALEATDAKSFQEKGGSPHALMAAVPLPIASGGPVELGQLLPYRKIPEINDGNWNYFKEKPIEALKHYMKALDRYPDLPELRINMGMAFLASKEIDRGETELRKAIALARAQGRPDLEAWAQLQLGWAALLDDDGEGAMELWLEGILIEAPEGSEHADALKKAKDAMRWNFEWLLRKSQQNPPKTGEGAKQRSKDQQRRAQQRREGKPGEGKLEEEQSQEGKAGEGGKEKEGDPKKKPEEGDTKPEDGKPQDAQSGDGNEQKKGPQPTEDEALKGLQDKAKEKPGAGQGAPGKRGAWSILPLAGIPILASGDASASFAADALAQPGFEFAFSNLTPFWISLAILPVLGYLLFRAIRKNHAAARESDDSEVPPAPGDWLPARLGVLGSTLVLSGVAGLGLGASDPVHGVREQPSGYGGQDIVFAQDVSLSVLLAMDQRFQEAYQALERVQQNLDKSNHSDRVALLRFAAEASERGLSADYGDFRAELLGLYHRALKMEGGSNLVSVIDQAVEAFKGASDLGDGRARVMILLSDGGEGEPEKLKEALDRANRAGVRIFTILLGSDSNAKMQIPPFLRKDENDLYLTKDGKVMKAGLNPELLELIARHTGGKFFRGRSLEEIDEIFDEINDQQEGDRERQLEVTNRIGGRFAGGGGALVLLGVSILGIAGLFGGRPREETEEEKPPAEKAASASAMAVLPVAGFTLTEWSDMVFPGIFVLVMIGLYLLNRLSDGALWREVKRLWRRGSGANRTAVLEDLPEILDLTEGDRDRLRDILQFRSQEPSLKVHYFVEKARKDPLLWRERLLAAFLSGNSRKEEEVILKAIRETEAKRIESFQETLETAVSAAPDYSWMARDEIGESLLRLAHRLFDLRRSGSQGLREAFSRYPNPRVRALARQSSGAKAIDEEVESARRFGFGIRRLGTIALAALAVLSAGVLGIALDKRSEFGKQAERASHERVMIIFREDSYLFSPTTRFMDWRIPNTVIPTLRDWFLLDPVKDRARIERMIHILTTTADPKADAVLVAAYKRSNLLKLEEKIRKQIVEALVSRDSDAFWRGITSELAANPKREDLKKDLEAAVAVLAESDRPEHFDRLWKVYRIKGVPQGIARAAFLKMVKDKDGRLAILTYMQSAIEKYGQDPEIRAFQLFLILHLWAENPKIELGSVEDEIGLKWIIDVILEWEAGDDSDPAQIAEEMAFRAVTPGVLSALMDPRGKGKDNPEFVAYLQFLFKRQVQAVLDRGDAIVDFSFMRLMQSRDIMHANFEQRFGADGKFNPPLYPPLTKDEIDGDRPPTFYQSQLKDAVELLEERLKKREHYGGTPAGPEALALYRGAAEAFKGFLKLAPRLSVPVENKLSPWEDGRAIQTLDDALEFGVKYEGKYLLETLLVQHQVWPAGKLRHLFPRKGNEEIYEVLHGDSVPQFFPPATNADAYHQGRVDTAIRIAEALHERLESYRKKHLGEVLQALRWVKTRLPKPSGTVDPAAESARNAGVLTLVIENLKDVLPPELETKFDSEMWKNGFVKYDFEEMMASDMPFEEMAGRAFGFKTTFKMLEDDDIWFRTYFSPEDFKTFEGIVERHLRAALANPKTPPAYLPDLRKAQKRVALVFDWVRKRIEEHPERGRPRPMTAEDVDAIVPLILYRTYRNFPSTTFDDDLVAIGQPVTLQEYGKSYSDKELGEIIDLLDHYLRKKETLKDKVALDDKEDAEAVIALRWAEVAKRRIEQLREARRKAVGKPVKGNAFLPLGFLGIAQTTLSHETILWGALGLMAALVAFGLFYFLNGRRTTRKREKLSFPADKIDLAAQKIVSAASGSGFFLSRFVGLSGWEKEGSSPWQPGDDRRRVDWAATARLGGGTTMMKRFAQERDVSMLLVVDQRGSMGFKTQGHGKSDIAKQSALTLARAAEKQNVPVGLLVFSGDGIDYLQPKLGRSQTARIWAKLEQTRPGGNAELDDVAQAVLERMRRRGAVVWISDFDHEGSGETFSALSSKHALIPIRISHPWEIDGPPPLGLHRMRDANTGRLFDFDTDSPRERRAVLERLARRDERIQDLLGTVPVRALSLSTEEEPFLRIQQHLARPVGARGR